MNASKRGQRGVTMVEVVVALAIIAIALLQIVSVVTHTMKMKDAERETQIAKEAAEKKIEEIRTVTFTSVVTRYSSGGTPGNTFAVTGLNNGAALPGLVAIDASNPNLLDIKVTIAWKGAYPNSSYVMRTLYTR